MNVLFTIIIIFILLFLLILFMILPRIHKPDLTILNGYYYAHRGLHDGNKSIAENSIQAFKLACDQGYGYELDVQLTKDGQVVVFHDETIDRMTTYTGNVRDFTYEELKSMDLANTGGHIPLFTEVLSIMNGKAPIVVEIKIHENTSKVCTAVQTILDDYTGPYCIESFNPFALQWYKQNRPNIIRGQLSTNLLVEEQGHRIGYFLVTNLLVNVLGRPDFIAYDKNYSRKWARRLVCNVFGALAVAWTIRSQKQLDQAHKDFQLFIFEKFTPKSIE